MRTEFNKLVELMQKYDLYNSTDEVGIALKSLFDKIIEVENRIKCVIDTNKDSHEILFTNKVKLEESIGYDNVEILQRSCNDIDIAIDMNDTECIENDWYGLFGTRNGKENVLSETYEVMEDKVDKVEVIRNISKEDFIIWNKVTKQPIEGLDIVYHYTTIVEMINDDCLVLGENVEFICVAELPLSLQKQINQAIEECK